jgi:hypothetical protein
MWANHPTIARRWAREEKSMDSGLKAVYQRREAARARRTAADRQAQKIATGLRARRRRLTGGGGYRA